MSLRDGTKKMSKSDPSDLSRIALTDDADMIAKKIRKAKTDSEPLPDNIKDLEHRAEALNLVSIFAALSDREKNDVCAEYAGRGFADFKEPLIDLAVEKLTPITCELSKLMADISYVDQVLAEGASRAKEVSDPILKDVHKILGFVVA